MTDQESTTRDRRPWFGPKRVGYGLRPQTWQGWAVFVALIVLIAVVAQVARLA
jgi:hypothetical protein